MKRYLITTVTVLVGVLVLMGIQIASAQTVCNDSYEPNNDWNTATQLLPGQYKSFHLSAPAKITIFLRSMSRLVRM